MVFEPVRLSLEREAERGKALLDAVDQRGDSVVALALHERIAVADTRGESRLEAGLAAAASVSFQAAM